MVSQLLCDFQIKNISVYYKRKFTKMLVLQFQILIDKIERFINFFNTKIFMILVVMSN